MSRGDDANASQHFVMGDLRFSAAPATKADLQTSVMSMRSDVSSTGVPSSVAARSPQPSPRPGPRTYQPSHGPIAEGRRGSSVPRQTSAPVGLRYAKGTHVNEKWAVGAHFKRIIPGRYHGESDEELDNEQNQLDTKLCTTLQGGESGRLAASSRRSSRSTTPVPMRAAFTDRSVRMREGVGARSALGAEDAWLLDEPPEHKGNCNCPACNPSAGRPAGQLSSNLRTNVLRAPHLGLQDLPQTPRPGRDPGWESGRVNTLLRRGSSTRDYDRATASADEGQEEAKFRLTMGVKVQPPQGSRRRSCSEEPRRASALPAGRHGYRGEMDLETAPHHAQRRVFNGKCNHRSEAAMTLAPDINDPAPNIQITNSRKGMGDCKDKVSTTGEQFHVRGNQANFRFEIRARQQDLLRSVSLPPERNPITSEGCEDWTSTWRRVDRKPRLHDTTEAFLNHTQVADQVSKERAERLQQDPRFAVLCAATAETGRFRSDGFDKTQHLSSSMGSSLAWDF